MSNLKNVKCPKCGNPYIRTHYYNPNYTIYVHKQEQNSQGLKGLINYCIVAINHIYSWPEVNAVITKLNPEYRTPTPPE